MKRIITTFIAFLILASLCLILNVGGCKKKENSPTEQIVQKETNQAPATSEKCVKLPALNEKGVKLIEAFVHEMNLLKAVLFSDSSTFEAQRAKFEAAHSDLSDLGSSNYSMATMEILAMDVSLSYSLARLSLSSSSAQEQELKSHLDNASQSRENFLETYHMFQRGTTALEVNKFLEDKVKNESTSK